MDANAGVLSSLTVWQTNSTGINTTSNVGFGTTTASAAITVGAGGTITVGTGVTFESTGQGSFTGIVTASSFRDPSGNALGATGAQGATGSSGSSGSAGAQGATGAQGASGGGGGGLATSGGTLTGTLNSRDIIPTANNSYDLGSTSSRWQNVYTTDLQLSNKGKTNHVDGTWGDYTIQEGESDLFLINNRSGKKYVFLLKEVS